LLGDGIKPLCSNDDEQVISAYPRSSRKTTPLAGRWSLFALAGIFALIPIQLISLPMQMDAVDLWALCVLIAFWGIFMLGRQKVLRLPPAYWLAIWCILLASLASAYAAVDPRACLIVVVKEIYLIVTLLTVGTLLAQIKRGSFHWAMRVWLAAAVLHGLLIIAEFLSPDLFRTVAGLAGSPPPTITR